MIADVFLDRDDIERFKTTLKEAFEHFLNKDNHHANTIAEFLAKYLDMHLKKSNTSSSFNDDREQNLEKIIEDVLQLFRWVKSKDVFEEFYARGLSRRLLLKKTASFDAERSMITKLKTECGD